MISARTVRRRLPGNVQPAAKAAYRFVWAKADRLLDDRRYLQLRYAAQFGRLPDLKRPRTLNEKILWRRLQGDPPLFETLCDKVAARGYVAERVGAELLIECYGVYERPEDIPWKTLPGPCVVKASHGSGWVLTVDDPSAVDAAEVTPTLARWLRTDYSTVWRERQYRWVPRRLIVERRLGDSGDGVVDFKLLCFHGSPKVILVAHGLAQGEPRTAFYAPSWERLPMTWGKKPGPTIEAPRNLDRMLEVAASLSRDLDFVRVDLYSTGDRVYFGELTLTPLGGFMPIEPREYDTWLGDFWALPAEHRDLAGGR